jgi:hypothetical protein
MGRISASANNVPRLAPTKVFSVKRGKLPA